MADLTTNKKFLDNDFQNWLKAALCMSIIKEGIEDVVESETRRFHQEILESVLTVEQIQRGDFCTQCSIENVLHCPTKNTCVVKSGNCTFHCSADKNYLECPKDVCGKIRDRIRKSHRFNFPSWKNTCAQQWCTNFWEVAKCYMPPGAYADVKSLAETDLNGLLGVMINTTCFKDKLCDKKCTETRERCNTVRHSPNLSLSDTEFSEILTEFVSFLTHSSYLNENQKVKEAVSKIHKIKSDTLPISSSDVTKLLENSIKENTSYSLQEIDSAKVKILEQMKTMFQDYQTTHQQMLKDILEAKAAALTEIKGATCISVNTEQHKEQAYQQLKESMKQDLIIFNKAQHENVPISPLTEEYDVPLMKFYVHPIMHRVDDKGSALESQPTKISKPVKTFHDIFFNNSKRCNEIYVTSDAGLGKTVYSKWLTYAWCIANKPDEKVDNISEDDLKTINIFDFVFLVCLRDSHHTECDIDQIIYSQIFSQLQSSTLYSFPFLQEILNKENNLIILDGLDEWSHPEGTSCRIKPINIPHRKIRAKSTIVTTTRPWKFDMVKLKLSQVEQHIEIGGLDINHRDLLMKNVLGILGESHSLENFKNELEHKNIQALASIPLILMHLLCLQCENKHLGKSRCEIYFNIVDFKISRAENKYECPVVPAAEIFEKNSENNSRYKMYSKLHHALGKLAFVTLFSTTREACLVFDYDVAIKHLGETFYTAGLKTGLLTQYKGVVKLTKRNSKVSFPHKTFQEFFSALYLSSIEIDSEEIQKVIKVSNSMEKILEMSNVFIFLSNLNPEILGHLSEHFVEVLSGDQNVIQFRNNSCLLSYWNDLKPLRIFQDMLIACVQEFKNGQHRRSATFKVFIQDVFIDKEIKTESCKNALKDLLIANQKDIKTLHINDVKSSKEMNEVVEFYKIKDLKLEKLDLWVSADADDIDDILSVSVETIKHLLIHTGYWEHNRYVEHYVAITDKVLNTLLQTNLLETLSFWDIVFDHEQLDILLKHLNGKTNMKQIGLGDIKCSDHGMQCSGLILDLSNHAELSNLQLNLIPLSNIQASVQCLTECHVGVFPSSGVLQSLLGNLQGAKNLQRFGCFCLQDGEEIDLMLETIPHMESLQCLLLNRMDLGDKQFKVTSEMCKLEIIKLKRIKVACKAIETLVKDILTLPNAVRFELIGCEVSPATDFELLKGYIYQCDKYVVLEDIVDHWNRNLFTLISSIKEK